MCMCIEGITQASMENEEPEVELSSGVMAAFDSFKAQLKEHFSVSNHSRNVYAYKKLRKSQWTL